MKRRDFIAQGASGAAAMGIAGCSSILPGKITLKEERTPIDLTSKVPKPSGTMPTAEIGTTGIKVSKYGFGSHMTTELAKYKKEREWMIREAYDMGITLFDVYDYEFGIYQYEPMGRYLKPVINDVVISVTTWPNEGRNVEQQFERDLRMFGRDYIDLVRIHAWKDTEDEDELNNQGGHKWDWWETLFKLKEKGYIRAVGIPVHMKVDLELPLKELPLDFVIIPYNFYHNWSWSEKKPTKWASTVQKLREKGIGIITMKPFTGDTTATPFRRLAEQFDETGEIKYAQACLRYIINSGMEVDATLGGMYNPYHLYENIAAFFNPEFSDEESRILSKIRNVARFAASDIIPEHYRFLEDWVPEYWNDTDLFDKA
ncbi:aldo/keto reductase [Candidatus Latescibacterota bacterium]